MEPENAQNGPKIADMEPNAFNAFDVLSSRRPKSEIPVSTMPPEFDRDETLVCMALAICLAGASTSIIYRLLG